MESQTIKYEISHHGDDGQLPFTETITVTVASGDPGGEPGEFAEWVGESLWEWYDGADVEMEIVESTNTSSPKNAVVRSPKPRRAT